jgi:hypothetical protein
MEYCVTIFTIAKGFSDERASRSGQKFQRFAS